VSASSPSARVPIRRHYDLACVTTRYQISPRLGRRKKRKRTLGTRHNHATGRCYVDSSNGLIMSLKFILKCEIVSGLAIQLDINIASDCECLPVGGEGMVGNWMMEQVVDLWAGHDELMCMR
jgi:hypothetical protein